MDDEFIPPVRFSTTAGSTSFPGQSVGNRGSAGQTAWPGNCVSDILRFVGNPGQVFVFSDVGEEGDSGILPFQLSPNLAITSEVGSESWNWVPETLPLQGAGAGPAWRNTRGRDILRLCRRYTGTWNFPHTRLQPCPLPRVAETEVESFPVECERAGMF